MQIEKSRREFVGEFFRLGGLFASVASWKAWILIHAAKTYHDDPIFDRPLVTEPSELIDAFSKAKGGALVYQCQLFFPIYITGHEVEKVFDLEKLCQQRMKDAHPITQSRLRIIPAIAAANTLASARENDVAELRHLISNMHRAAAGDEAPCRMTLGIFWTCMTAVVQRNKHNWERFLVGTDILNEAKDLCLLYIQGDESTAILLQAASSAWQFLQTYRTALALREDPASIREYRAINACMHEVRSTWRNPRYAWLGHIEELCQGRLDYDEVLPEFFELIIGRSRFQKDIPLYKAADFSVLLRLQHIYLNHLVGTGNLQSEYIANEEVAVEAQNRAFALLVNYGVTPKDWPSLKSQSKGLLTIEATRYFDSVFGRFDSYAAHAGAGAEEHYAKWLSRQVPFRKLPEEVVAEHAYDSPDIVGESLEHLKASVEAVARLAFCMPAILHGLDMTKTKGDAIVTPEITQAIEGILQQPRYDNAFGLLAERAPQFREKLSLRHQAVPPLKELGKLAKKVDSLKTTSVRNDLTEKGDVVSPNERRVMAAPSKSETSNDKAVDLIGPLSLPISTIVTLLAPSHIKIKFPNREIGIEGFGILYDSGYGVEAFGNHTFGLSSEKQLQLLMENSIPYEIVKG